MVGIGIADGVFFFAVILYAITWVSLITDKKGH
jgi:hypothetical protein